MTPAVRIFSRRMLPAIAALTSVLAVATPASPVMPTDWTAYLGGPAHTSARSDPAITPAIAPSLSMKWQASSRNTPARHSASPPPPRSRETRQPAGTRSISPLRTATCTRWMATGTHLNAWGP